MSPEPHEPSPDAHRAHAPETPLDAAQLALLEAAGVRRRALSRVVMLAHGNGVALIAAGLLCLPFAALEPGLLLLACALLAIAAVELLGAARFRRLQPRGARMLAWNQLALFLVVLVYCAVSAYHGLQGADQALDLQNLPPELSQSLHELSSGLGGDDAGATVRRAYRAGVIGFYAVVALTCALYQGGCAFFYLRRGALLQRHLASTPRWVLEVQRRMLGW